MREVDRYLQAADRAATTRSYGSAVRHFEIEWKGLLPATTNAIADYLSHYATTHSVNTLKQRLAALSRWHTDHGFTDPTKSPLVRQVLKGVRTLHAVPERRARPLELAILEQVDQWLAQAIETAALNADRQALLVHTRNRSLVLLGFWRGFRSDELSRLRAENVVITPGKGMDCYLGHSKGDRQAHGKHYRCPALSRLCPLEAYEAWIQLSGITQGAIYRKIDRWGRLGEEGLHPSSLIPLLRTVLRAAGIADPAEYSSHSLRRGFAGWARDSGWDLKELMDYVGWQDVKSAMRYLDASSTSLQARFEQGLSTASIPSTAARRANSATAPLNSDQRLANE